MALYFLLFFLPCRNTDSKLLFVVYVETLAKS